MRYKLMKRGQEVDLEAKYGKRTEKDLALIHAHKHELE